jgi:nitroreductase
MYPVGTRWAPRAGLSTLFRRSAFADPEGMTTTQPDFTSAVELARLAPSIHNTQPWHFLVEGDTLVLSRDPQRRLASVDPTGRQQVISCGAALHLAAVDLRMQGFDPHVEEPARPRRDNDLAVLRPVAGHVVSTQDVTEWRAARTRHTQRERFADRAVEPALVAELRAAAEAQGAWVRVVGDEDLPSLAVLLSHADEIERDDPAYRAELAQWTQRPAGSPDGLPAAATPSTTGRGTTVRLREFVLADPADVSPDDAMARPGATAVAVADPPPAEHPLTIVLGTEADGVADWLRAGGALMALWLRATLDGVQASMLGQVVDMDWSRSRLGALLGVVGHPQLVLRLGYGHVGPDTPRRPVSEVLG